MFEGRYFYRPSIAYILDIQGFGWYSLLGTTVKGRQLCEIQICRVGHKASGASRRRSSRSLLWTAGKAYTPAVLPVCCLSGVTLHYISSTYLLTSLCIPPYILLWIPPCPSSPYSDVSTWITINKTADFLIVTLQKPCFTSILVENRLFDQ